MGGGLGDGSFLNLFLPEPLSDFPLTGGPPDARSTPSLGFAPRVWLRPQGAVRIRHQPLLEALLAELLLGVGVRSQLGQKVSTSSARRLPSRSSLAPGGDLDPGRGEAALKLLASRRGRGGLRKSRKELRGRGGGGGRWRGGG